MITLTDDQRNRLMNVATRLTPDDRAKQTLAESQAIADRIDKVLYELHMENPLAFVTNASLTLAGPEFLPIHAMIRRRKFYDEPAKPAVKSNEYATFTRPKHEAK